MLPSPESLPTPGSMRSPLSPQRRNWSPRPAALQSARHEVAGALPPEDSPMIHGCPMARQSEDAEQMPLAAKPVPMHSTLRSMTPLSPASHRNHLPSALSTYRQRAQSQASKHTRSQSREQSQEQHQEAQEAQAPHLFLEGAIAHPKYPSPRDEPRRFSWDAIRRVTGFYADVYRQL